MQTFEQIRARAEQRKGGADELAALLPKVRTRRTLEKLGDDRFLAEMTRCVFQAGFVWRVINQKWDDFETVFFGFAPEKMVLLSPEQLERIAQDTRIVRNHQKVLTVPRNARYLLDMAAEHGSFAKFVARWPDETLLDLHLHMKKHGSRLGGVTGQRVLRNCGRDTWVLSADVIRCLQGAGVEVRDNPASQRELRLVADAFNQWREESGLPFAHISRIAACSVP